MHPLADTGRVIAGRYRLQAPIGRGAMGVVWRARDQLLDRDVAVKEVQIADTLSDAERATAYQRTLREAKTAARLNHPAVVTVYDVCEDGGRPWIVMQLIHAQSLDEVLAASGPLSARRAAEMGRQLLSALSVAHAAGVLHRDVKPSNVLLGSDDRAVLTDFGIATFQGDPKLTQTGMVMGSPGFTAPERIRGEDASPASDLWSLGATLFAAIEGHGPFERRGGAITTMSAIINEDAPEAPTAGALGPVIAALLRREPADRPDASAAARMITDVLPLLVDRPPDAPGGYQATALSSRPASPYPGAASPGAGQPGPAQLGPAEPGSAYPGPVPSRRPQPAETSLDFASADQTIMKEPADASTGPPAGQVSAAQTAPTTPQPVLGSQRQGDPGQGDRGQSDWSQGDWSQGGRGQGAGVGYAPGASAGSAARLEGPPPDFSSWYDPSPRSGSGSAWSGSAPPPPAGHGPAPWQGPASQQAAESQQAPASQQAPGSAPWSGAGYGPPPRQRSGPWWKISIAALAIIGAGAGVGAVVLLHHNNSASPHGKSSASASASATLASPATAPAITDAINRPAASGLPAGWITVTHHASAAAAEAETAGFTLAAPASWTLSTSGHRTYLRDSSADAYILIDLTPHTYPNDMLAEAEYIKSHSLAKGSFPGYSEQNLAAHVIRGTQGSYWKFTWQQSGVTQQVIDLFFVAQTSAGPQSYALYMTAPASTFNQLRPTFDEEVETFATLPK